MSWFYVALITPIVHAFVNHIDKYLLSKYLKGGSVGTLVLFSSLFSVIVLPFVVLYQPAVLSSVSIWQALLLISNGAILVVAILCYLYALESDEASYIAPLFQLIPVFSLLLGYFFLGEVVSLLQFIAILIIILGGVLISLEFGSHKITIRKKAVFLMVGSSILYAVNLVVFKLVAGEQGFVTSLFWDLLGKVLFGIVLFICVQQYRKDFLNLIQHNSGAVMTLNGFNEVLALLGEASLIYAALLAPVAIVQSVSSTQPFFVFLIGLMLTIYFPKFSRETLNKNEIIQKGIATVIIVFGAILLNLY